MPDTKLARRFQILEAIGYCTTCQDRVTGPDATLEDDAASHTRGTGHEVRITQTRLIIIAPQAVSADA